MNLNAYCVGLAYSSLPKLVHAHARHIITGKRIDLTPHQLIGNKLVKLFEIYPTNIDSNLQLSLSIQAHHIVRLFARTVFTGLLIAGEHGRKQKNWRSGFKASLECWNKGGTISTFNRINKTTFYLLNMVASVI